MNDKKVKSLTLTPLILFDLILVTRNTKYFNQIDIKILNPFIKEGD